jgi:hypothetical protein
MAGALMEPGDSVVYLDSVDLYGVGTIEQVLSNGRLVVSFDDCLDQALEQFSPHELELYDVWKMA